MVENIMVICHGKRVRMLTATKEQLIGFFNISVGTEITGVRNGRKVKFQYIGKGFDWVEA